MNYTLISGHDNQTSLDDKYSGISEFDKHRTNELFIGIVAPIGAGPSTVARILKLSFADLGFETEIISVSKLIYNFAKARGQSVPSNIPRADKKNMLYVENMQFAGNEIRKGKLYGLSKNHSRVAHLVVREIVKRRAKLQSNEEYNGGPIEPDDKKRVYIIDSLRNPAESKFLKTIYGSGYYLLGVVCDAEERVKRFRNRMRKNSQASVEFIKKKIEEILKRDEGADEKYGQKVSASFQVADYFVNNTHDSSKPEETGLGEDINRFINLITKTGRVRPTIYEEAMYQAHVAKLGSACLSRQVGAALINELGIVVSTGKNDVPMPGGGLYRDQFFDSEKEDGRCAFHGLNKYGKRYCRNTDEQVNLIEEIIEKVSKKFNIKNKNALREVLEDTPLTSLIEFSRAIHAEMDAILSANLAGISTLGCRMCVTTYPCHSCARHLVAAGIIEVVYIEPYPKSKAVHLHGDSITKSPKNWEPPITDPFKMRGLNISTITDIESESKEDFKQKINESKEGNFLKGNDTQSIEKKDKEINCKVLFHPFVGVAPSLYPKVFLDDRELKNKKSGVMLNVESNQYVKIDNFRQPYYKLELELTKEIENDGTNRNTRTASNSQ